MDTFLQTKFFVPQNRAKNQARPILERLHLQYKLDEAVGGNVTLVSAPTGFGKTTLVAHWVTTTAVAEVAWLSLDENDNDLFRFLAYFIQAIRGKVPTFADALLNNLLQLRQIPALAELLPGLLNQFNELPSRIILVLDDFHLVTDPAIHELMQLIVRNHPRRLHLVILSRNDLPWPVAKLRSRGELTELRSQDLRLTREETAQLMREVMGFDLTAAQITLLDQRVEGWVAGLQMAALSLDGHADISGFLHDFAGDNRFVHDYLFEEVFSQQSQSIQSFLLGTAVLDQLCAPLCDAVLDQADSRVLLRQIEKANLFLIH